MGQGSREIRLAVAPSGVRRPRTRRTPDSGGGAGLPEEWLRGRRSSSMPMDTPTGRAENSKGPGAPSGRAPRTITKKELVARIADRTSQTKVVAKEVIQMFLDEIIRELG